MSTTLKFPPARSTSRSPASAGHSGLASHTHINFRSLTLSGCPEVQEALDECLVRPKRWQPAALRPYIVAVQHALNCKPRRVLQRHTAAEAYHHQSHARYSKRERL